MISNLYNLLEEFSDFWIWVMNLDLSLQCIWILNLVESGLWQVPAKKIILATAQGLLGPKEAEVLPPRLQEQSLFDSHALSQEPQGLSVDAFFEAF